MKLFVKNYHLLNEHNNCFQSNTSVTIQPHVSAKQPGDGLCLAEACSRFNHFYCPTNTLNYIKLRG